ncbi:hypothetical protein [Cytobacillus oceanisediminis]|uniref:hypothetical protein n=1 Tax=Cytobacillus oceanisediminis TaxID=665099 RepID=UPI001FB27B5B|nr:hypothetical protein [Cytobacillus oceanisediminis]UOE58032.1 hypothetical protein IRB79_27600 [Cytobacillus oceanisediminis]
MFELDLFLKEAKNEGLVIKRAATEGPGDFLQIDFDHPHVRYIKVHPETREGDTINIYCGKSEVRTHTFKNYKYLAETLHKAMIVQVHIRGTYKKDEEPTFYYFNDITEEQKHNISKEEVLDLARRDFKNGLLISYPSGELSLDEFI